MQGEWLAHTLGRMEATIATGFLEVHRRIDDQERTAMEWRRHMMGALRHVDRKKGRNGHGSNGRIIRYLQLIAMLGFVIAGTLGYKQPAAFREIISTIAAKVTLGLIGGA